MKLSIQNDTGLTETTEQRANAWEGGRLVLLTAAACIDHCVATQARTAISPLPVDCSRAFKLFCSQTYFEVGFTENHRADLIASKLHNRKRYGEFDALGQHC